MNKSGIRVFRNLMGSLMIASALLSQAQAGTLSLRVEGISEDQLQRIAGSVCKEGYRLKDNEIQCEVSERSSERSNETRYESRLTKMSRFDSETNSSVDPFLEEFGQSPVLACQEIHCTRVTQCPNFCSRCDISQEVCAP